MSAVALDRCALVRRHNPRVLRADPLGPLSVGNGGFAFTADITGLQSFPAAYRDGIPLVTQSQWGWHTLPNPAGHTLAHALTSFDAHGRSVPYATETPSAAGQWLRANPHRLGLGRIGFAFLHADGTAARLEEISAIEQTLDLGSGLLTSRFAVDGVAVQSTLCCHPELDLLAVTVASPLIAHGRLRVRFDFPYGTGGNGQKTEDWGSPLLHETEIVARCAAGVTLRRTLDADAYFVRLGHETAGVLERTARHEFSLVPGPGEACFAFTAQFSAQPISTEPPRFAAVQAACASHWARFWGTGGAIDLSDSSDPRAPELERRVVLSQYLTAIQCAGSQPPQETGLTGNSWYGKFHLEMHWWHGVHFALWDRLPMLEMSLAWYRAILPMARETARLQGYAGARWPKMVGPDGREGPSPLGALLIWQQPHPIYYAELCYRARPDREVLEHYREMVHESAEFMASYATWVEGRGCYVLGPPLIPAQECYDARTTANPTFELAYWAWGLATAQRWRERLGLSRVAAWDRVLHQLAPLPVADGAYLPVEGCWKNRDHPAMLAACGMIPGTATDCATMRRTLRRVRDEWDWGETWGWDYPLIALTAARLGEPGLAVDALLMETPRNRYLPNGHNYQTRELPLYLPGNGGLLTAVAMMAAGWDDAPAKHAPGFPCDGGWQVRWENLRRLP